MAELKRLFSCLHQYRRDLFLGMALVLVETCFELVIPVLMADLIDIGVASRDVHYILVKGAQMGACALLALGSRPALCALRRPRRLRLGSEHSQGAVQKGPGIRVPEPGPVRDLQPRHEDDHGRHRHPERRHRRAETAGAQPVMLVMGVGLSVMMNARLALVFIICAPVLGLIMFFVVRSVAPRYAVLQRAVDRLNAVVQENLTAIRAVRPSCAESTRRKSSAE